MGEVYAALDRSTGKTIALKRLHRSTLSQRPLVVHFMREYHALAELRHPRIIEVYDYGVDRDTPYYTMELLDGRDLRTLSPLPFAEACFYLRDVASSLALLHARKLLHRDVSPRNVRRTSDGRCKLLDFGAMIPFGLPPNVIGTAPCVSPEALQGARLDQRSDLYSLGALAYSLVTGRHAYPVSALSQLPSAWREPIEPLRTIRQDIPVELDELVMSLLSMDPMKRPGSAAEVIHWLSAIAQLPSDDTVDAARSFLTSSRLCGRARTVSVLQRQLQRAVDGAGSALAFTGLHGCGKSRMLNEAALIGQTLGLTVLRASGGRQLGSAYPVAQDLVTALRQLAPVEAELAGAKTIEWPPEQLEPAHKLPTQHDPGEARARLQEALTTLFTSSAKQRPLLLVVDDLELTEEFSISLLTALAHQTPDLPLAVVTAESLAARGQALDTTVPLHKVAAAVPLEVLARHDTSELVESMFGRVPNLERLDDWLYRAAHGNPKLTIDLAEHLLERGVVRYAAGTWVLPSEDIVEAVPRDITGALALRLLSSSASATALAELLCVRRRGASPELCLSAADAVSPARGVSTFPPAQVFSALDELVRKGVLESAGHQYVFAQEAVRTTLQRSLSAERVKELHACWAQVLLAKGSLHIDEQLEAGWHLVHTDDALRGADLLAEVGPALLDQGQMMASAIPAVEKALAIYEQHGKPLHVQLRLRSALVLAGLFVDHRIAERYGDETLRSLFEVSGLALAARLARTWPAAPALWLALGWTFLRRLWLPQNKRGPVLWTAVQYFARTALGLQGARALALDARGTTAICELIAPLAAAPAWTSGPTLYAVSRALMLQQLGREGELELALRTALRLLRSGRKRDMSPVEYQTLLTGTLLSDAMAECYRENSRALERADTLEAIGTRLAQVAAARIRMIYYLRSADMERAEYYRQQVDLYAIQGGTTWQVDFFAVPVEGLFGALWLDLVMVRRSLDCLERLLPAVPSVRTARDAIRIGYHVLRKEYARAVELGELYLRTHAPRSDISWGSTYARIGQALIELGRIDEALRLLESALASVSEADRCYTAMYGGLELAYATAVALHGERERAAALFERSIERLGAAHEYVTLVALHRQQARLARLFGDHEALTKAHRDMRHAAVASGSPALMLLADRTVELRLATRSSPRPAANQQATAATPESQASTLTGVDNAREETATANFLRRFDSAPKRCRYALQLLARVAASHEAYLFSNLGQQLAAVASLDARSASEELKLKVHELLRSRTNTKGSPELEQHDHITSSLPTQRFRVFLLPATPAHHAALPDTTWVGAVALGESADTDADAELPKHLIADLGQILSAALSEDGLVHHSLQSSSTT